MKKELLRLLKSSDEAGGLMFIISGYELIEFAEAYQMIDDRLLTKEEAAKQLEITTQTLYTWTRNGIINKIKTGGKVNYKQSEVDRIKRGDV